VRNVLVIDDEPKIVSSISRALAAQDFQVDGAADGRRGLELAKQGAYAMVVLDLRLPGLDGLSVLREAREARPQQQIIVLSASTDVETRARCLNLGAVDFVPKPFSLEELVARVESRLRARASGSERCLSSGALLLDLRRRQADVGSGAVQLPDREFDLLEYLVRREGEVCSREELLEAVWGFTFDPGTNVVDVCVARLRAKLGRDLIETVRNAGYCLQAP
jgi:DNA-binding response OmpR family regulator